MIVKTLIITIILVTIVMLALAVKLLFGKSTGLEAHSCALEEDKSLDKDEACTKCELKDLIDCPENSVTGISKG